jgi:hypothetical protein
LVSVKLSDFSRAPSPAIRCPPRTFDFEMLSYRVGMYDHSRWKLYMYIRSQRVLDVEGAAASV